MTTNQGKSWTPDADLSALVNGTETRTDWNSTDWKEASENVRRLRQRIFRATQEGDLKRVRSLQKLMLRSHSNRLISVRRVTQENQGSKTAGVDKVLVKTPRSRGWLVDHLATLTPWKAKPTKRVYIPKANGKTRPLGIPVMFDRAVQAMVKNALEPSWEAKFEASSYGFRPGRGGHDAIADIYNNANGGCAKRWVLDADIHGAFDNISHDYLLEQLDGFPAKELIRQWLKAGYVEMGILHPTEAGTPQGGVISPLLANIALHGMEQALGVKAESRNRAVIRYADDFVVFCKTKEDAEKSRETLTIWLKQRGLSFSEDKTRIVHLTEGFDFLSFNVRHYEVTDRQSGYKLLIKPSKAAVQKRKDALRETWMSLRGVNPEVVCQKLNPIIRGWANYHRIAVAQDTFENLDQWMFKRGVSHLRHNHPKHKTFKWLAQKGYLGRLNPKREDNHVFGNASKKTYLLKFSWFPIERHVKVKGRNSPDDPNLTDYWQQRRMAKTKSLQTSKGVLARKQKGKCLICGQSILEDEDTGVFTTEETHIHHRTPRKQGGNDTVENLQLIHLYCHQQVHTNWKKAEITKETNE